MSGVAVISSLLRADAGVLASVAATRIFGGPAPLKMALPAIAVVQISGVERLTTSMAEARRLRTERVQVTVYAGNYVDQKAILELVRTACANRSGTVATVTVDSILPDGEGPDIYEQDTSLYEQSRDFIVKWKTP